LSNAVAREDHTHPAAPVNGESWHRVHNFVRAPGDVSYRQNHHGVWHSRDGVRHWDDMTDGLPSAFGALIAVHPHDPETIWILSFVASRQVVIRYRAAIWALSVWFSILPLSFHS